jgi:hypothetical protein
MRKRPSKVIPPAFASAPPAVDPESADAPLRDAV